MAKAKKDKYEYLINCNNAWIDSEGNFIPVGYMQHNAYAIEYLEEKLNMDFLAMQDLFDTHNVCYHWEYLCKVKGWIRLMNWTGRTNGTHLVGYIDTQKPTETQKNIIFLWCAKNGYDYEKLFEL